jgi:BirA family biotin operon repressor/biotin-[acetyl-CoA-carboxylase] ligase
MNNKFQFDIIHLSETDSTNTYLKNLIHQQDVDEFTTVLAEYQRSGRGQEGNSWESERNENLLFSFVLYPDFCEANKQFYISQAISLGVKSALSDYTPDISIKWPNDIYWKEKKICGMLIENELYGSKISQSIAGIGININQKVFRSNAPNPVSLYQITHKRYDTQDVLINVIAHIKEYYRFFMNNDGEKVAELYFDSLFRKDGFHHYRDCDGDFWASITHILPVGTLILTDKEGKERRYNFKEVSSLPDEMIKAV